jgi:REP element-mobilizing transposase RayT
MPTNLHRYYGAGYSHFITTSCYQRRPLLVTPRSRDLFLEVLEQMRQRHQFVVVGYVVMPEHVHLLLSEPERGNPSLVLAALKQNFAHRLLRERLTKTDARTDMLWSTPTAVGHVWQRRFYDSLSSPRANAWKSCATCTAILCSGV